MIKLPDRNFGTNFAHNFKCSVKIMYRNNFSKFSGWTIIENCIPQGTAHLQCFHQQRRLTVVVTMHLSSQFLWPSLIHWKAAVFLSYFRKLLSRFYDFFSKFHKKFEASASQLPSLSVHPASVPKTLYPVNKKGHTRLVFYCLRHQKWFPSYNLSYSFIPDMLHFGNAVTSFPEIHFEGPQLILLLFCQLWCWYRLLRSSGKMK